MKHFLIKYQLKNGTREAWHQQLHRFVEWLDSEPDLKGRISYRCMAEHGGTGYYHLATASDDEAIKTLQGKDVFKRYTESTKLTAGGEVEVVALELVAGTA